MIRLKLDENLSRRLKDEIAALGYDAVTAGDERLLGRSDIVIAEAARAEGGILLTLDLEFADR
jgi:predicted nuclease of predicted toxin-antitoxin system